MRSHEESALIRSHLKGGFHLFPLPSGMGNGSTGILSLLNLTFGQGSPSLSQWGRVLLASYPYLT
jgi:hypothetical protein